jgi:enediyne biosynthesis protein E4
MCQGRKILRSVSPAYSYLNSNDPRVHFGLGSATSVDSIIVRWPDGTEQSFPGTNVDQIITLKKK